MSNGVVAAGAGGSAAMAAVIAQAVKATGAIIKLEPQEFEKILARSDSPLVVIAPGGFLGRSRKYLTGYRGLFFYTSTGRDSPLRIEGRCEVIRAGKIWIPG